MSTGASDRPKLAAVRTPITGTLSPAGELACRIVDVVIASLALILLAPVMALIALAIRVESEGPVIFRQVRLGRSMQQFTVNKFRTMRAGVSHDVHREFVLALIAGAQPAQTAAGPRFKLNGDARVTRVGSFLRRTSLDELPQLWNVIRGDMSLVGPRPPIPYEVEHYRPEWVGRFDVKPGVTGLWQVSGRCELTIEQMIELDLEYVRRRSFALNIWILLRTIPAILTLRGAS